MTTRKMTDEQLMDEIRLRFEQNLEALNSLKVLNQKLERVNEKLQESEALKSQFLSNIRNEVNNPLSAIMGLASQCLAQHDEETPCSQKARMIYAEAFNLDFQMQNIFMAAELEAGETDPSYAIVDLVALVRGVLTKLSYRIQEKRLMVTTALAEGIEFTTDPQKLEIILLNLLSNAVEFNHEQGVVDIAVSVSDDRRLQVRVSDEGPGIDPESQKAIFDRFQQLDSGSTKEHRGHGLGLSICSALAELMNGRITLDSSPGSGCSFILDLPEPDVEVSIRAEDANFFLFDEETNDVEQF